MTRRMTPRMIMAYPATPRRGKNRKAVVTSRVLRPEKAGIG